MNFYINPLRVQIYAGGLRDLFERPSPVPSQPCVAPHENHDWSSVGIFKGPQLGVRGSPRSSTFRMRASAGVLNPSVAQLSLMWRLDWRGDVHHMQRRREREYICMCETGANQRHFQEGVAENTTEEERSCSCRVGGQTSHCLTCRLQLALQEPSPSAGRHFGSSLGRRWGS